MGDAYLVTGVPGFIGKRLVRALMGHGRKIYLLCEHRFEDAAHGLVRELEGGDQLEVTPGDITRPDLGLGPNADRLRGELDALYHLAAVYDLAVGEKLARKVNVDGTARVIDYLKSCGRPVAHNYISTCYVAGERQGIIFEDELDCGQRFKNHYESTKFEAEVLVERSKSDIPSRIFRPAVVIGDSQTGETDKFDGPYPTFGAIMMGWLLAMPGPGHAPINLVPIDYVIQALSAITLLPDTVGRTYQLADPQPLTARELVELVAGRLGAPRPRLQVPQILFKGLLQVKALSKLTGITPEALAYFNHYQVFDTTNTRQALEGTGVSCPPIPTYLNQILRYYRARADLPWSLASA